MIVHAQSFLQISANQSNVLWLAKVMYYLINDLPKHFPMQSIFVRTGSVFALMTHSHCREIQNKKDINNVMHLFIFLCVIDILHNLPHSCQSSCRSLLYPVNTSESALWLDQKDIASPFYIMGLTYCLSLWLHTIQTSDIFHFDKLKVSVCLYFTMLHMMLTKLLCMNES